MREDEREQLLREIDAGLADFESGDYIVYGSEERQRFLDEIRELSKEMHRQGLES